MDQIVVRGLTKSYGNRVVLNGIDLSIESGEIVAVLGPNGAGKTTMLEILEGHRKRDGGEVRVLGLDPANATSAWRARIGIVLQEQGAIEYLTVREALDLYGGYYPNRRPTGELLDLVDLADHARDRVDRLSGGARRRLDVALGLVGNPELLFLDEPTTGFDPEARRQAWAMLDSLRHDGLTILLTTHYLDEATALADRVVILRDGSIVTQGTPDDLTQRAGKSTVSFRVPRGVRLPRLSAGTSKRRSASAVEIDTLNPSRVLETLARWSSESGVALVDLTVTRPSLEDVYLELIS